MTANNSASTVSCEYFPPKTDKGMEKLLTVTSELKTALDPAFFSVTFGAGGSTRDRTLETVQTLKSNGTDTIAPHISCIGSSQKEIEQLLDTYVATGVKRLVALRGDIPEGETQTGDFNHASELVSFIRQKTADRFHIEVAAYPEYHPESPTPQSDFDNFVRKVKAGADSAITQYFYNIDAYSRFIDKCRQNNVDIPVVPGVMPITSFTGLSRFSDRCGAEIPRWIRKQLEAYQNENDEASIRAFGIDVVTRLCQRLLDDGAPGLHFYTLNKSQATIDIWNNLNH